MLSQAVSVAILSGLSPLHLVERTALCCHYPCAKYQLCSLACLARFCVLSLIPSLLPRERTPAGVGETVSPSSLDLAVFTSAWALVLSSGPSLPLQNVPIARAPPSNSLFPWELSLKEKQKQTNKPVPRDGCLQGAGELVPGSSLPAMPTSLWAQNKPKPSLYVDDALL